MTTLIIRFVKLVNSLKKGKQFVATFEDQKKTIHFGSDLEVKKVQLTLTITIKPREKTILNVTALQAYTFPTGNIK